MRRLGGVLLIVGGLVVASLIGVLVGNAYERYFGRPWIGR